jgi:hypothetical protein
MAATIFLLMMATLDPCQAPLVGFSRGNQAALYASLKRSNEAWDRSGMTFAAYILFYPD